MFVKQFTGYYNRIIVKKAMKFFPFKIMFVCLLLPPLLYAGSLNFAQRYLDRFYQNRVENIFLGDTDSLYDGSIRIRTAISRNIERFLRNDKLVNNLGIDPDIQIIAGTDTILYPSLSSDRGELPGDYNETPVDIARRNWEIINKGLKADVSIDLDHGETAANLILSVYLGAAVIVFLLFYKRGLTQAEEHEKETGKHIDELLKEEEEYRKILKELKTERNRLFKDIDDLNQKYAEDRKKAETNEEEMFNEIISLEEKLNSYIELKQNKEDEIQKLKYKVDELERRKTGSTRRKMYEFMEKRFSILYKNIAMTRKALTGLMELNDEQQIKAEEVIHQLNENPDSVIVKRKVFSGKKSRIAALEVTFAYTGRLYYMQTPEQKIEILLISTKKNQKKDMEYLHNL